MRDVGLLNLAEVLLKLIWNGPIVGFIVHFRGCFWIVFCELSEGRMVIEIIFRTHEQFFPFGDYHLLQGSLSTPYH